MPRGKLLTVASLTVVSPAGAVTDAVTLYFFLQKSDNIFTHRHHSHPLSSFHLIVRPVFFANSADKKF